jgi:glucan phosphoethanolaminetransferase (alkaline phosphatase superfamily)
LPYIVIKFLFLLFWILIFLNIRKLIRRKQKLLIIFLFKNTLLFGAIFVLRHNLDFKNYGVILQNNVNIYSNMDPNSKIDAILPSATVVKIINQFDGFYQIKNKGTIGFVDQKCLEKICN